MQKSKEKAKRRNRRSFYAKSLAHRVGGYRYPHLNRQRLCLERLDASHHGGDGHHALGDDGRLLDGHPLPRHHDVLPRQFCREDRAEEERPSFNGVLRSGDVRHVSGDFLAHPAARLSLLRRARRRGHRHRLYGACVDDHPLLPTQPRPRDGTGHHGLWLCDAVRRADDAAGHGDLRHRRELPDHGHALRGHHAGGLALP